MPETAISAHNLTKVYKIYDRQVDRIKEVFHPLRKKYHRDFYALKNLSFNIKKGETVGIIGKNGSGKSTLLQIVTGVLTPTSGFSKASGRILALLELGAGFNPELTGIENIYFNGTLMGASQEDIDKKLDDIINFADIGAFVNQPVKSYSSGMFVRLAFAVIANMDADILIIDEALSVGDAFFAQKCMRFLREFKKTGTIFFVSHDMAAVLSLCDHAIYLNHGQIKAMGAAKEVCEKYLEDMYAQPPNTDSNKSQINQKRNDNEETKFLDQRRDLINNSCYRNDIEIFKFDPEQPSFGQGGSTIIDVKLLNENGDALAWVVGGEKVILVVRATAKQEIRSAIIGFYVKDRLGQTLFGDNTYLTTVEAPFNVNENCEFYALFTFIMPFLPVGDYSVCVAVAEGSQQNHVQHHWIHDALFFKSQSSSVASGLVGIPMLKIELNRD
jgi:lipopolysaccharide transport system ATP-binding protein